MPKLNLLEHTKGPAIESWITPTIKSEAKDGRNGQRGMRNKVRLPPRKPQGETFAKKKGQARRELIKVTLQLMKISIFVVKYMVQKL